jgi:thioredoxin-like negative regulator of GroEL
MNIAPLLAFAVVTAAAVPASGAEFRDFDRATFEAAQAAGRPTLVDVHAWWCPVCASQGRTIKRTVVALQYDKLLVLRIDYDKQKPQWRSFGVTKQATLIAFKRGREVGRIAYQTDKSKIEALLAAAVS